MTTFAIGEVAIYTGLTGKNTHFNGEECIVIGPLAQRMHGGTFSLEWSYQVEDRKGRFNVMKHQLRKRRPPSTDESESRQAMLDCIERARRSAGVPA